MTLSTFFQKFDQFADAPDAVARMRELVLELAVRGQLSERQPKDQNDPAWRAFLDKFDNRIYGSDPGPPPPFSIPDDWRWACLEDVGTTKVRNDVEDRTRVSFVPMALISSTYGVPAQTEERTWSEIKKAFTHFADGDVVMAKITPCFENAKSAVMRNLINGVGAGTTELHVFRKTTEVILPEFVLLYIKTRGFITRGESHMTGSAGQKRVPREYFATSPFPLPPLAEQKRIVAKVDELMALCDRLALQQQERETQHAALARASLSLFSEAPTPANLEWIFHPSYPIPPADLRKAILTLAVQGKLVPQDPNDEPAEELAAELARLKTQLLAGKRIRNQKVSDCPSEDDFPFEIPASWKWVRLGHAVTLLGGYAYESGAYVPSSSNQIIRLGNVKSDALLLDQKPACIPDALAEQTAEYVILEGDILVTMTGTKAKRDYAFTLAVKRADLGGRRLFLNQRVGAIRPFQRELVPLINVFLKSDQLLDLVFATATGTANQANIGTSSILDLPFPLPPLAEQRRIVAKVDQLMALVDALETQLAASRATAANLLSALVAELTSATPASEPESVLLAAEDPAPYHA